MTNQRETPTRLQGGAVGDGFQIFMGLPLVLVGIVLLAKSWRYVPANLEAPPDELAKFFIGWILLAGGLLASLGGETWFLDSRSRTFVRTWKFLRYPLRQRIVEFDQILSVRFSSQFGRHGAHRSFRVEIILPGGVPFVVGSHTMVFDALDLSVNLAQAIGVLWENATSGVLNQVRPEQVLRGLVDRPPPGSMSLLGLSNLGKNPGRKSIRIAGVQPEESTEILIDAGHLMAKGAAVPDQGAVAIPVQEILSVEVGDRLVVLSRNHFLECGQGLGTDKLNAFRQQIVGQILLEKIAAQVADARSDQRSS